MPDMATLLEPSTQGFDMDATAVSGHRVGNLTSAASAPRLGDRSPAPPMKAGSFLCGFPCPSQACAQCYRKQMTPSPVNDHTLCQVEIESLSLDLVWAPITICPQYPRPFETLEQA